MNHYFESRVKMSQDNYLTKMRGENTKMSSMEQKIVEMEERENDLLGRLKNS